MLCFNPNREGGGDPHLATVTSIAFNCMRPAMAIICKLPEIAPFWAHDLCKTKPLYLACHSAGCRFGSAIVESRKPSPAEDWRKMDITESARLHVRRAFQKPSKNRNAWKRDEKKQLQIRVCCCTPVLHSWEPHA